MCKWGGLLFLWNNNLDVELVLINSNVIALVLYSDPRYHPWLLKLVYCPTQHSRKIQFWEKMSVVANSFNGPMLDIGDFNSVASQVENFGGRPCGCISQANGLKDYMDRHGMTDLGFYGPKCTWTNNR